MTNLELDNPSIRRDQALAQCIERWIDEKWQIFRENEANQENDNEDDSQDDNDDNHETDDNRKEIDCDESESGEDDEDQDYWNEKEMSDDDEVFHSPIADHHHEDMHHS